MAAMTGKLTMKENTAIWC